VGELSDMKPKPLIVGSLAVAALVLLLLQLAQLSATQPLDAAGAQATMTPPDEPGDTPTPGPPTVTPAARAFAPIVFELGRAPTPVMTHTPPAPPDGTPTPTATPVGRVFVPAVFELGRPPTPVVTRPTPTLGPTNTPPAPPP